MNIGLDIMGGDNSPHAHINAAKKFSKNFPNINITLYGKSENKKDVESFSNINFTEVTEYIETTQDPLVGIKTKKDSSIVKGIEDVKNNNCDAFISSGSTGALVAGSLFLSRRIKGVDRVALPLVYPSVFKDSPICLLDVGANTSIKPSQMVQHAFLAKNYVESVFNVKNPKVALLNIGSEETKGTELYVETYNLLSSSDMNFVGNIEARDILNTDVDVIVCDGFTGNVLLKTLEGTIGFMSDNIKKVFMANAITKVCGLFLKPKLDEFKDKLDYKKIGATPILGCNHMIFKAHGSSNEEAIYYALVQCKNNIESDYINKIKDGYLNNVN